MDGQTEQKQCLPRKGRHYERVIAWLLVYAKWTICQWHQSENKLLFVETMVVSALYHTNRIFLLLVINSPQVDILFYSDTFSWVQSLLLLLNAAGLAEKYQLPNS